MELDIEAAYRIHNFVLLTAMCELLGLGIV